MKGQKQRDVFILKYNMLEHYKQEHDLDDDEESAEELNKYRISSEEKEQVVDRFKIKGQKLD